MNDAVSQFLEHGSMGILALGFVVLLLLYWRSDKRAQRYAAMLENASLDRTQLIQVVKDNTKASAALAAEIGGMAKAQDRTAQIMASLERRLVEFKCPLSAEAGVHT